jgi:hypothetical protein
MTGFCVTGDHANCPNTHIDDFGCSCPCHLDPNPYEEN